MNAQSDSKAPPSTRNVVVARRVFTGDSVLADHAVVLDGRRIEAVCPLAEAPKGLPRRDCDLAAPGFVDLQINGAGGVLFNDSPSLETLTRIAEGARRGGVAYLLPTLISDQARTMDRAIAAVRKAIEENLPGILGIHLEGPFLNPEKKGIHLASHLRGARLADVARLGALKGGRTLVTLAPELAEPGVVRALGAAGVVVFAGHTNGGLDDYVGAAEEGLRGFTHLFNAMSPMTAREPGAVGAALFLDELAAGVIADGHHVHAASLALAVRAKPPGTLFLVSDAMPTLGSDIDRFVLCGQEIRLGEGRLVDARGTLAGAHLALNEAVRNLRRMTGVELAEALRMASTYPAEVIGLGAELGRLAPGYRAGLTLLDDDLAVRGVIVDGRAFP